MLILSKLFYELALKSKHVKYEKNHNLPRWANNEIRHLTQYNQYK